MIPWKTVEGAELLLSERSWLRGAASAVSQCFEQPVIVNIGVYRCASMYCLRVGASQARIVGVDLKKPVGKIHPELNAEFIIMDSRTCPFEDPVHFVFVDGDHRYPSVKADIANWVPKIVPGGVIAFHDYAPTAKNLKRRPHLAGVKRAVDEWAIVTNWRRSKIVESIIGFKRPE